MKNSAEKTQRQEKLPFYLQLDVNLWERVGLSKNARHLHFTLLKLADAKTGEVRIGVHWFTPAEIDRQAKMCHVTRKLAMRELLAARLVHCNRDRVERQTKDRVLGKLRKHIVWGNAHFYVSLSPRQDWLSSTDQIKTPGIHKVSSTDKKLYRRRNPHEHSGSSTVKNQPDVGKESSTVNSFYGKGNLPSILSRTSPTTSAVGSDGFEVESDFENIKKTGGSSKSTTPENLSEPAAISVHPEIQNQRDEIIREAVNSLRRDRQQYGRVLHRDDLYEIFKKDANSLGWDLKEIQSTWKRIWEFAFPSPKQVEDYLAEQLTAYIEKCISNPPKFTWDSPDVIPAYNPISFHETDKLLEVELFYRRWPFELCDAAMQERIYARVEAQFGESLTKPEDRYGYQIIKSPPADYVPDHTWLCTRANLLAMDWTEYPRS